MIKFDKTLVCASKYFTTDELNIINSKFNINNFGENRVEALLEKKKLLIDKNYTWHLIGHLQTNKIKSVINEIDYLHSLSNLRQAEMIQKYREKPLKCFIQLNISKEDSKNGISLDNLDEFISDLKKYDKIEIVGFMTIGVMGNLKITEEVFIEANHLKEKYNLPYLSMGMTDDYLLAIKHGATHIRIGSYFKTLIGG